jgi:hypothetical protein
VPLTVNRRLNDPTNAFDGDSDVIVGPGKFTVNKTAFDVPPPGGGFTTVILAELVVSAAVRSAVSCVLLTKVVTRSDPFH